MLINSGLQFDLATNFDPQMLDFIEKHDENHQVFSLFGKFKTDVVGGGRSANTLPDVTEKQLISFNERCKKMGINFNYLLNPLCLGNRDVVPLEHMKILDFLHQLDSYGIEWVTINSPYLCEIIKRQFPNMKVSVGQYAIIQTVQQAKMWADLGADEITLSHNVNRDFDNLRDYLTAFKGSDVKLRVIANNICLHDCPFNVNHGACVSHSSTEYENSSGAMIDYNIINCYYRKLVNPANLIASDWIRPEDLHYYKELCDETGNPNLLIKLVERSKPTAFLNNVLYAYLHEKYDGSLTDIVNWLNVRNDDRNNTSIDISSYIEEVKMGRLDLKSLDCYMKSLMLPKINIDNNKLDGFLDHFVNHYHCKEKLCWMKNEDPEPDQKTGIYCHYCSEWAKKVITVEDEKEYMKWRNAIERLKDNMSSSRIFNVDNRNDYSEKGEPKVGA